MKYTRPIKSFADEIVADYSTFDSMSGCYILNIDIVPEFVLHEFSALFIKEDPSLAYDAMSESNSDYEKRMFPSLLRYLSKSTDRECKQDFASEWRDSITNYFIPLIENVIEDQLRDFNEFHGYVNQSISRRESCAA